MHLIALEFLVVFSFFSVKLLRRWRIVLCSHQLIARRHKHMCHPLRLRHEWLLQSSRSLINTAFLHKQRCNVPIMKNCSLSSTLYITTLWPAGYIKCLSSSVRKRPPLISVFTPKKCLKMTWSYWDWLLTLETLKHLAFRNCSRPSLFVFLINLNFQTLI